MNAANSRPHVRAPELSGDTWFNTAEPLTLAALRGKLVLLDFWTSGCVNCLHVLDELRPLEQEFADVLVTIGVHSPKFAREGEADSVAAAVARYGVEHPVVSDPEMALWQQYAVKAWPTLVVVDPEGYVAHVAAGEGHGAALRRVLADLVTTHEARGTLRRGPDAPAGHASGAAVDTGATGTAGTADTGTGLRFPAKAVATAEERVLVADTANHSIVEYASDIETVVRRFGDGHRGHADGAFDVARFAEPSGLTLLPTDVAAQAGYHLLVADTGNHLLRGVDLRTGAVRTVAGTGRQWRDGADSGRADDVDLTSPWDVRWWEPAGGVVVAMAGNHTLGLFDPVRGHIARFAGTTVEGLRDGPVESAFFAQTSGLAVDGERLWLVDAETSALRWIEPAGNAGTDAVAADAGTTDTEAGAEEATAIAETGTAEVAAGSEDAETGDNEAGAAGFVVRTAVGVDLFTFGHRDGQAEQALLQHPTGLSVLPDGAIVVADTYNGALRRYDQDTGEVSTLLRELAEPSGLLVTDTGVFVVESAAHRIRRVEPGTDSAAPGTAETVEGDEMLVRRPPTVLAPGGMRLSVVFTPPEGEKLDQRYGPSTRLEVSASPPDLLVDGAGAGTDLERTLTLAEEHEGGVVQVVAQAASCAVDAEYPVCRVTRQDWGVPVRVDPDGASEMPLVMAGTPAE